MRFVPVKSPEQQGVMVLHRTRLVLTRQRTQLSNAIRGHMAEFDLTAAIGREGLGGLIAVIPGVGPLLASAMVAAVADPAAFKTGRNLAAWIGLVSRQSSSGGKERLGGITKQGDRYLRQMLVVGLWPSSAKRNATACVDRGSYSCWLGDAEGCGGRARQQERPDDLGDHDQRRALQVAAAGLGDRSGAVPRPTNLGKADDM